MYIFTHSRTGLSVTLPDLTHMEEKDSDYQQAFDNYKEASDDMDEVAKDPDSTVEDFQKAKKLVIRHSDKLKNLRGESSSGYEKGLKKH